MVHCPGAFQFSIYTCGREPPPLYISCIQVLNEHDQSRPIQFATEEVTVLETKEAKEVPVLENRDLNSDRNFLPGIAYK